MGRGFHGKYDASSLVSTVVSYQNSVVAVVLALSVFLIAAVPHCLHSLFFRLLYVPFADQERPSFFPSEL